MMAGKIGGIVFFFYICALFNVWGTHHLHVQSGQQVVNLIGSLKTRI
jgi:hypothetical protein